MDMSFISIKYGYKIGQKKGSLQQFLYAYDVYLQYYIISPIYCFALSCSIYVIHPPLVSSSAVSH